MDSKEKGIQCNNQQRGGVSTVAQHIRPPLGVYTSHVRVPSLSVSYSIHPLNMSGREQMAQYWHCYYPCVEPGGVPTPIGPGLMLATVGI